VPEPNNIVQGAVLYSTLASVLSGFAFTAIVLLVVTWLGNGERAQRVLGAVGAALVASFFGLIIIAVGYAAEATNPTNSGLVASENTVLGAGFAGVGVLVLSTVVLMLDAADAAAQHIDPGPARLWEVARFARIGTCVLNLLIMGLGYNSISLFEQYKYGPSFSYGAIDVLAWVLLGAEFVIMIGAIWLIVARPDNPRSGSTPVAGQRRLSYAALGLTVASGAGYLVTDTVVPDGSIIPAFSAVLVLVSIFLVTAGATIYFARTRPVPIVAPQPPVVVPQPVQPQSRVRKAADALLGRSQT